MNTEFKLVEPSQLDSLPEEAMQYLNEASKSMDGYFPIEGAFQQTKANRGEIYLVIHKLALVGAFFLNFHNVDEKRMVMNMPLLGGKEIWLWSKDLSDFLYHRAEQLGIYEFTILGRDGWGKLFPDLEKIGTIFRKKVEPLLAPI